jgi:hypothetical protein
MLFVWADRMADLSCSSRRTNFCHTAVVQAALVVLVVLVVLVALVVLLVLVVLVVLETLR